MLASDSVFTHKHHYNVKDLSGKKCTLKCMQYFLFQLSNKTICCYFAVLTETSLEMFHNESIGLFIALTAI